MPKLELMGPLVAARMGEYLNRKVFYGTTTIWYWTDSSISLGWITGNKRLEPFVANRVSEIRRTTDPSQCRTTDPSQWRLSPGSNNPADLITRGCSAEELLGNQLWWKGPDWLRLTPNAWPENILSVHPDYSMPNTGGRRGHAHYHH